MFITLSNKSSDRSKLVYNLIQSFSLKNPFNPGLYIYDSTYYITVRAFGKKEVLPFESYLIIYNQSTGSQSIINLSDCMRAYGIIPAADPKFFTVNQEVWITFNTGYKFYENNDIYVFPVNELNNQVPWKCMLPGRRNTEKNWAFFKDVNNKLCAIYSLTPLIIIEEERRDEQYRLIFFRKRTVISNFSLPKRMRFTIGTQLVQNGNDYYLVAHQKIFVITKLIYFGRLIKLTREDKEFAISKISNHLLFHSFTSILGNFKKHNKGLISCTYFSGLCLLDDMLLVSYGINDLNYNVSDISFLLSN